MLEKRRTWIPHLLRDFRLKSSIPPRRRRRSPRPPSPRRRRPSTRRPRGSRRSQSRPAAGRRCCASASPPDRTPRRTSLYSAGAYHADETKGRGRPPTAFLEKGEPLRERSPQHSLSTKGLGPCASQPGGPFSSRTALGERGWRATYGNERTFRARYLRWGDPPKLLWYFVPSAGFFGSLAGSIYYIWRIVP